MKPTIMNTNAEMSIPINTPSALPVLGSDGVGMVAVVVSVVESVKVVVGEAVEVGDVDVTVVAVVGTVVVGTLVVVVGAMVVVAGTVVV